MNGLEALETVKYECGFAFGQTENGDRVRESFPVIEKELKALEIIKEWLFVRKEERELGLPCLIVLVRFSSYKSGAFYITHDKKEIETLEEVLGK